MNAFHFKSIAHLVSGLGSISELTQICSQHRFKKLLIITDLGIVSHRLHHSLTTLLDAAAISYQLFDAVQHDPDEESIYSAVAYAKKHQVDGIIGFGGGSVMDVAKVVAILAHPEQQQQLSDLYGIDQAQGPRLKLILIPTTAGTGSEVTPIAIVTTGAQSKMGIVSEQLYADIAILDAQFTQSLPAHVTAATGIDAMVHAIEAYTSQHKKNIMSDLLAVQALKILVHNLPRVLAQPLDLEARQQMLYGAMLAGQAFANAPVAAVHALAYPLGSHCHLSHGHSNALLLVEILKFNAPVAKHLYAELMQHLEPRSRGSVEGLCDLFIDHMQQMLDHSGLTLKLSALDVPVSALPSLAKAAMLQTRLLQNNPRPLSESDALHIYQAVY